ncbi:MULTISPECIES: universal stress protein [unclassified Kitasatospora]|uniref:universal stress protein n=1 Tax=unclassified Kitasatospora TaxID=2633591 RepID=UPI00340FC9CA
MTRYVLAGLDGSPQSEAAASWAAEEAQLRGATLRLLHVRPWLATTEADLSRPGDLRTQALRALTDTASRIRDARPDLTVETTLIGDTPTDGLVAAAAGRELLVLGSRGLGGFATLLVGSVSLGVAARADTPVVLVRSEQPSVAHEVATHPAVREVVLGLDARHPADPVIEFAFAEAALRGARLLAVHGWNPLPAWSFAGWVPPQTDIAAQKSSEKALLVQALAPWREKYPEVELVEEVHLGSGAQTLLESSDAAGLIVVGRRVRRHDAGMRLGPVAHAVLHHAAAPVAVVPHP